MSGKAILIPGCNFLSTNLGIVTIQSDGGGLEVALQSISIELSGSYTGRTLTMTATYQPFNTTQIGVSWSIVSGNEYATISANGVLTFDSSANASLVVVLATSTVNSSITATTTLVLTYDTDAKCNISWLLAPNTSSSVGDTQIDAGETLTFTLSPDTGYTVGDFKIMMGDTNISKECTVEPSNDTLFGRKSFTITTPEVTNDLVITNECHRLLRCNATNMYCSRIIYLNNIYKTTATNNFMHYGGIIPVTKGDVLRMYVMPTGDSLYDGFHWRIWNYELNTTDWTLLNHTSNYDVSQYVVYNRGSAKLGTVEASNSVTFIPELEILSDNAVGTYLDLSATNVSGSNSAVTANSNFTTAFSSSNTPSGIGACLKNVSNVTGQTAFLLVTVNETILEGGYYEDYNYGVTEISND